jgi:hypothetical protein
MEKKRMKLLDLNKILHYTKNIVKAFAYAFFLEVLLKGHQNYFQWVEICNNCNHPRARYLNQNMKFDKIFFSHRNSTHTWDKPTRRSHVQQLHMHLLSYRKLRNHSCPYKINPSYLSRQNNQKPDTRNL